MDRLVECPVCLDPYDSLGRKPAILPCGHTICLFCAQNNLGRDRVCPICRAAINLSSDKLQINYALIYDPKPTLSGPSLSPGDKDDIKRVIAQLLTAIEQDQEHNETLQRKWRALQHSQTADRLKFLNALNAAIEHLQQASDAVKTEFAEAEETARKAIEEEDSAMQGDVKEKLEAVEELSKMLAGNVAFNPERLVVIETQVSRPLSVPVLSTKVFSVPDDFPARAAHLTSELVSGVYSSRIVEINPKNEAPELTKLPPEPPKSLVSSIDSRSEPSIKRDRRREKKDQAGKAAEEPSERQERNKGKRRDLKGPEVPDSVVIPGGQPAGARWMWVKNNQSLKEFAPDASQVLEAAFQSGEKQVNLMNQKTGELAFTVMLDQMLSFKNGRGKPRPVSRQV